MADSEDNEDDYMSDKYLQMDYNPGLMPKCFLKKHKRIEDNKERGNQNKPKSFKIHSAEQRNEKLNKALDESNKGFAMLAKMGFKAGMGLGRQGQGRSEPIPIEIKEGRKGLGKDNEETRRKQQRAEALKRLSLKRKVVEENLRGHFKSRMRDKLSGRLIEVDLHRSQNACQQLDNKKNIQPEEEWMWPPIKIVKDDEEVVEEDVDEEEMKLEVGKMLIGNTTSNLVGEFSEFSEDIRNATLKKYNKFEKIRGKESSTEPFWDVVVLSALDEEQKKAYEIQLNEKLARKELPLFTTYHVVHDPIGVKVGNGGGVMTVLDELEKVYHEKFNEFKILLLLSGGYSQRLPCASLLGKIFTTLPLGNPIYQMLELKLSMYIDFPKRMKPGVLVSSADCIELYELEGDLWHLNDAGFTSMAYPSPIEIGTTHGVHVIQNLEKLVKNTTSTSSVAKCRRFLHKPTKELMRSSKAVFDSGGEEYVYSDSNYFMDTPTAMLLLKWYRERGGVQCEIDAYGDFLQALGSDATDNYCQNVENVAVVSPSLVQTRKEIFSLLHDVQHNVLLLNKSRFYHLGTTKEYIEHLCKSKTFRYEMGCTNTAMVKWTKQKHAVNDSVVVIHSLLHNVFGVGDNVIIEYSSLNVGNDIGANSIISNNTFGPIVNVPENSFLHTVVIRTEGELLYVTVAFGVEDDLKKCANTRADTTSLTYCDMPLDKALEKLCVFQDPWPENCELLNLWHAKLFPAFYTAEDALHNGATMLQSCRGKKKYKCPAKKAIYSCSYSMADVLQMKDLNEVLNMRNKLRKEIDS